MTQAERDQHILMKLANPDGYAVGESYTIQHRFVKFEKWLEDVNQFHPFAGDDFHNDSKFFAAFSVMWEHEPFDHRHSDEEVYRDQPYVLRISGDDSFYAVFFRFGTYWELLDWLKSPVVNSDNPMYSLF